MNRICLLLMLLVFMHPTGVLSSGSQKIFGAARQDHGFDMIATSDGGYALAGYTNSSGNGDYNFLLIKLDSNENQQWSKQYGGNGNDFALQIVQTSDSGFVLCGKSSSYGAGGFDAMLVKTNNSGVLQWAKTYGGFAEERLLNVRLTSDGGFILAGSTNSFGQGDFDMLFIKTDFAGDTLWTKIIGGPLFDQGTDADIITDSGFIFCGRSSSGGSGSNDVWLSKVNANGDTVWTRYFGGAGWDEGMKVKSTLDDGFIVTGASTSFTNGSYDVYLNKVSNTGHLEWSKIYSGAHTDATYDVIQLADSGYIITGETESFGNNKL